MSTYTQGMRERDADLAGILWAQDCAPGISFLDVEAAVIAYALETPYEEAHAKREGK